MFTHFCILNFVMYIFFLLVAFFGVSFLYKGSNGYMKRTSPVSVGYVVFFLQWSLTSYLDRVSLFNVIHKWIFSLSWNLPMVTGWAGSVSVAAPAQWSTWPSPCSGRVDRWPWWVSPRNPFMWRMFFRTSVCKEKIKHLCMPLSCTSAPSIVKFVCS